MTLPILNINLNVDKDQLIKESKLCDYVPVNRLVLRKVKNRGYKTTNKIPDYVNEADKEWWWKQRSWQTSVPADSIKLEEMPETCRITSLFQDIIGSNNIEPNFFTQQKNTEVKMHKDVGIKCAINFILQGKETPIEFEDYGKFYYQNALLDITQKHSVPLQIGVDRLVFKLRILDKDYTECREKIYNFFQKN